jgi:DNA-binding transcriptional LysR family regulator
MAALLLPRSITALKARAPNVTVEIIEGTHDVLLAGLRSGELDVAVIRTSTELQASDLRFELLFTERFLVVTDSRQRFRTKVMDLAQLVDRPWILPPHGVPVRQRLDAAFMASAGRVPMDVIESASILVNQQLLDEGGRFALMPENVAHHYGKLGLVSIVKVSLPEISGQLTLAGLADRVPMPVVSDFLEDLRTVARMLEKFPYSPKRRNK